jgi:hypothetical protein
MIRFQSIDITGIDQIRAAVEGAAMHQKRGTASEGLIMYAHALIGYERHFPSDPRPGNRQCRNYSVGKAFSKQALVGERPGWTEEAECANVLRPLPEGARSGIARAADRLRHRQQ